MRASYEPVSGAYKNAFWLVVLGTLQGERQNTVPQRRLDFVRVNLKEQSEGPDETTATTFLPMVRPRVIRPILALSTEGHRIAVNRDLQIVRKHTGQFRRDDDPVLM